MAWRPLFTSFLSVAAAIASCALPAAAVPPSFHPTILSPRNDAEVRVPFQLKLAPLSFSFRTLSSLSLKVDGIRRRAFKTYPTVISQTQPLAPGMHYFQIVARTTRGTAYLSRSVRIKILPARTAPRVTPTATPHPAHSATPTSQNVPDLGSNPNLNGFLPFPADNAWNTRIDSAELQPTSQVPTYLYSTAQLHPDFGGEGAYGIPINVIDNTQTKRTVTFDIPEESDPGPYPVSLSMLVENGWVASDDGDDHHLLVLNRDTKKLYEIYNIRNPHAGIFTGYSGAIFDTMSNATRPLYWTSSDAAGLPIFPALLKYEEVAAGQVNHALRFTLQHTFNGFVPPASHAAGYSDLQLAPMGMRVRLKASVDISHFGPQAKVIATAMKKYGMILADNGSNWFFQGTNDQRWDDDDLNSLKTLHGSDFEVIRMPTPTPQE